MKSGNTLAFVGNVQRLLALWVLGCYTDGTMVRMTGLRLNAADREHVTARGVAPIRTQLHGACDVKCTDQFASRANSYLITQARAAQCIMHK